MDTAPREIRFAGSRVLVWDDLRCLQTHFPDGSYVPAAPQDTDQYRATCRRLGYPEDAEGRWQQCLEHEVMHTFVSERLLFFPHSPTLWRAAHGLTRTEPVNTEEAIVFAWQVAMTSGHADPLLVALCGGQERYRALLDEARALVRPAMDGQHLEAVADGRWVGDPRD